MSVANEMTGALPTRPHPGHTALYRFFDAGGALLYVGICDEPIKRWYSHADKPWWPQVETFRVVWFPSREAAADAESTAIVVERPRHNIVFNGVPYSGSRLSSTRLLEFAREEFGDWPFSLHDVADSMGMPYVSVAGHVRRLHEQGLFEEVGKMRTRPGRPLVHFRIATEVRPRVEPQPKVRPVATVVRPPSAETGDGRVSGGQRTMVSFAEAAERLVADGITGSMTAEGLRRLARDPESGWPIAEGDYQIAGRVRLLPYELLAPYARERFGRRRGRGPDRKLTP